MTELVMPDLEFLRQIGLFWGMNDRELHLCLDIAAVTNYVDGEVIFQEGDPCDRLYIVLSGLVKITTKVAEGTDKTLEEVQPGTQFGEMALIDNSPRSATAVAVGDTLLLSVLRDHFLDLIEANHAFGAKALINLARTLANRLRVTNDILRQTIEWNLKISGATALNLAGLVKASHHIRIAVAGSKEIEGVLLNVERSGSSYDLTVEDDAGQVFMIPYHAILYVQVGETR